MLRGGALGSLLGERIASGAEREPSDHGEDAIDAGIGDREAMVDAVHGAIGGREESRQRDGLDGELPPVSNDRLIAIAGALEPGEVGPHAEPVRRQGDHELLIHLRTAYAAGYPEEDGAHRENLKEGSKVKHVPMLSHLRR